MLLISFNFACIFNFFLFLLLNIFTEWLFDVGIGKHKFPLLHGFKINFYSHVFSEIKLYGKVPRVKVLCSFKRQLDVHSSPLECESSIYI